MNGITALFWLTLLIFIFALYTYYWRFQFVFNSSALSLYTPNTFSVSDTKDYKSRVAKGREQARYTNIIICGMVRDVEDNMPMIKRKVEAMGSLFNDYRVYIVENDSQDLTREMLLDWNYNNDKIVVLGCGINAPKCSLKLPKTIGHDVDRRRIEKMTILRNVYMDALETDSGFNNNYPTLVAIWDMDLVGSVYLDGVLNSVSHFYENDSIQALCSNGVYTWGPLQMYYDTYAMMEEGDHFHIDSKTYHDLKKGLGSQYKRGDPLVKVTSCFSGFTLYRYDAIRNLKYDMTPESENNLECEHVRLHRHLNNISVNPSMINQVIRNL